MKYVFCAFALLLTLTGCGVLSNSYNELDDGFYRQTVEGQREKVYVEVREDYIKIYPVEDEQVDIQDTANRVTQYNNEIAGTAEDISGLWERSFDVDFLAIPLKFRPSTGGVPPQLNADLNGAVYLGYRVDRYSLGYEATPTGYSRLQRGHLGLSIGVFTGLGSTALNPTTTNNHIEQEYDGIVWLNGVAAIAAINNITLGISLGFDSLMDGNSNSWVYQGKPWLGLAVGLNLN